MSQLEDLLQQCSVKLILPSGGWGTGFFVAPDLILTCAHVVREATDETIQVRWQKQENWAEAVMEKALPDPYDVALLRVTLPPEAHPTCVYLDGEVRSRDPLYLFGYPDQDFPNGCPVTVNCEGLTGDEPALIKFALGQVRPGMSGAPLLNQRTGEVCGMVKFTRDRSFDLGGGAILTDVILAQFPELRELQQEFHQGDRRWNDLMSQSLDVNFQPYLKSIATTYEKWWRLYTLTDAEGKQPRLQDMAPIFDFGQMVQSPRKQREANALRPPTDREDSWEENNAEKLERFPALEGLRKYAKQQVLLVGRPGSGKSTALARLLLEEAALTPSPSPNAGRGGLRRIPILVELRYWQGSIERLILNSLARHGLGLTQKQLETVLSRSLILFDGVNELPSEEARSQLAAFRRDHPKLPMIFTTRDLSLGGDLGIEKKLEMQPLTEDQMQAFIRAYLPEQAESMIRQLKDRLQELGQTPLLLWMLCEVFKQAPENQLPFNLAEVFQAFTATYENSSVRKHEVALLKGDVRPLSDRRLWKKALKTLAFTMMQGETPVDFRVVLHRDEAEQELSKAFSNEQFPVRDILDDLLKYHLLQNHSIDQIEFRHQLIQDYYAAVALLERLPTLSDAELQQQYLNYLKWTEPVALMVALVEETQAIRVVKLALDVDLMLGARLAGAVRSDFHEKTVELINQLIIQKQLPDWLKVELWGRTRSDVILSELLQHLNNPNIEVARTAAAFIGQTNDQAIVKLLKNRLAEIDSRFFAQTVFESNDQTGDIWTIHVEALAYIAPQTAIEFLQSKLLDQARGYILFFTQASGLLMRLDPEKFLMELIKQLKDPRSEHNKTHILNLISSANESSLESSIPGLVEVLEQENDVFIQKTIIKLLGKSTSEIATQVLISFIAHTNPELRKEVVKQLVQRKIKCFDQLEELMARKDLDIAYCAAFVLGRLGNKSALPLLFEMTRNDNVLTRANAAIALGSINDEESVSCLLNLLQDDSLCVRREAAFSLSNLDKQEAIQELLIALNQGDWSGRSMAIKGLARLNKEKSLWNILQDKAVGWQTAAVELGKLGKTEVLPYLRQALVDLGHESSGEVIHLLSKFADFDTCNWLADALDNPESYETDQYFCNRIACVLVECCPEIVANQLPALQTIVSRNYIRQIFWIIPTIQNRCKFYNYEIHKTRSAQPNEIDRQKTPEALLQTLAQEVRTLANQPKNDFSGANFNASVNFGDNPTGDFIGIQHNYTPSQNQTEAAQKLNQLLNQLRPKYPNDTDAELFQILINGFNTMPTQNPQAWQRWQDIFSVVFSGGVEATKILVPIAGIPIEVLKRLYEIYDRNRQQLPGA